MLAQVVYEGAPTMKCALERKQKEREFVLYLQPGTLQASFY